jgi:hypothetical protein
MIRVKDIEFITLEVSLKDEMHYNSRDTYPARR